ncbi:hypothetical protein BsIDN1_43900 [Bacillus safensis]|uniref:4-hydroxy-3-methylbut-2-enyl diphosphate reductase n=1 Tax=Bacillus safensis TaxID=561879 RepID=A0A5S9MDV9_BACIA|nr:hypothetical protein BsIDN1_43900 [Bacillus safensis]
MNVIKISPRGYCYGVVDAMVIAKNAALDKNLPRPILYIRYDCAQQTCH